MTQQMPNDEVDTALILEGELKRRVKEIAVTIVREEVKVQMAKLFAEKKAEMLMEVSIAVGKTLRVIENEGRAPLWEATPEDFVGLNKETEDAIRQ